MNLSTTMPIAPLHPAIDYQSQVVLLGSCFTENIGEKLDYYGFKTCINPFGIIFNPHSIKVLLERSILQQSFTIEDVTQNFTYLAHSDLNTNRSLNVITNLNNAAQQLRTAIHNASHVFITLGTAWIYELKQNGMIVANCHKQPQSLFTKRLLTTVEIEKSLEQITDLIHNTNPNVVITFTLSPVRHLKDGFVENQHSKSRLHNAIQDAVAGKKCTYFPAYEIVMDELRDYRFYARDMMHVNDLGIDYVWSRFRESVLNTNTTTPLKLVENARKLMAHKPTNPEKHKESILKAQAAVQAAGITINWNNEQN